MNNEGLIDIWKPRYEKRNQWRDVAVKNYIDSLVDDDVKQILRASLSGTVAVSLYGKSQVGKTTFLLKLMDIKDEYLAKMHDILRCGSEPGKAATPTAMIYKRNPEGKFRVRYATHTCEFEDESDIRLELVELRRRVESQELEQLDEIVVEIPEQYFNDSCGINIQVCDLPGIDSSNERERPHVEKVLKKFIRFSALILVFQLGHDISGVSNLFNNSVMSEMYGWKHIPDNYRLIITRAYSANSVDILINNDRLKISNEDIRRYYREEANKDATNPNNVPENVKIFPFEFGDSFREDLPKKYDEDKLNSIISVMNDFWTEIREDIRITSETGNVVKRISVIPQLLQKLISEKEKELKEIIDKKKSVVSDKERIKESYIINNRNNDEKIKDLKDKIRFIEETPMLSEHSSYNNDLNKKRLLDFINSVIIEFHNQLDDIHKRIKLYKREIWISIVDNLFSEVMGAINKKKIENNFFIFGPQPKHRNSVNESTKDLNEHIKNIFNPEISIIKNSLIQENESEIKSIENHISENSNSINTLIVEIERVNSEMEAIQKEYSIKIAGYKENLKQESGIFDFMEEAVNQEKVSILNDVDNKTPIESFLDLMYLGLIIKEHAKQKTHN